IRLSHSGLGTTPNIAPPSSHWSPASSACSRNRPSERVRRRGRSAAACGSCTTARSFIALPSPSPTLTPSSRRVHRARQRRAPAPPRRATLQQRLERRPALDLPLLGPLEQPAQHLRRRARVPVRAVPRFVLHAEVLGQRVQRAA